MVTVTIYYRDTIQGPETIECSYQKVRDGFLMLAFTEDTCDKTFKAKYIPADKIDHIEVVSKGEDHDFEDKRSRRGERY